MAFFTVLSSVIWFCWVFGACFLLAPSKMDVIEQNLEIGPLTFMWSWILNSFSGPNLLPVTGSNTTALQPVSGSERKEGGILGQKELTQCCHVSVTKPHFNQRTPMGEMWRSLAGLTDVVTSIYITTSWGFNLEILFSWDRMWIFETWDN